LHQPFFSAGKYKKKCVYKKTEAGTGQANAFKNGVNILGLCKAAISKNGALMGFSRHQAVRPAPWPRARD
jgi:hypothetical protein